MRTFSAPPGALTLPTEDVAAARAELSAFVLAVADRTAQEVGFGFVGSSDAPSTYGALRRAFADSAASKRPLPVSNENLSSTIYLSREADLALRFWHDVSHVRQERSFSTPDELDLALWHVAVATAAHLSPLAVELLDADLIGQTLLYAATKGYAGDQLRFDLDVLTFGVADAIVLERERQAALA